MKKYLITIDLRMINYSGIGTYLRNLLPFLKESFFAIKAIGNDEEIKKFELEKNIEIIPFNVKIYSLSEQLFLPFKIPRVDLFWSPHFNVPLLPIRARKKLVTIHDVFHLAFYETFSVPQRVYIKTIIEGAVCLSNKIITVSNFSKSEIIKYTKVNSNKIEVIYNGVDRNKFRPLDKEFLSKFRTKYPEKFILYVGNVKPHKNLKNLLRAFSLLLRSSLKDYYLLIVGKKEGFITGDKDVFKILEEDLILRDKVIFTSYIQDNELPILYNLASLFVFPSLYEGFGLPPLEAMACGCPTVVSNTAALPEICGDASFYVNPYDPNDIADGIIKVLNNKALKDILIKRGFERVKLFSWKKSAEEHLRVIQEIIF